MDVNKYINKMIPPSQRRTQVFQGGVIQIWVTRACDNSCFGCTQGSNLAGNPGMITLDQFDQACVSLKDYFGVVGMFGGNPAVHPEFDKLCDILAKYIPKHRRGLWCNNPLGHGKKMRETFNPAVSNLNVHLSQSAYDEFKRDWPESLPFGLDKDSRHAPVYTAMKDLIDDEQQRWELISNCDINKNWSAMIGVFHGELRGYFCEIAGAQAMLHQHDPDYPDTGFELMTTAFGKPMFWWQLPITSFKNQIVKHCHECGVPLRGHGALACSNDPTETEQVTACHQNVFKPKRKDRLVQLVTNIDQLGTPLNRVTDYVQNSSK